MTLQRIAYITQADMSTVKRAAHEVIGNKHRATPDDINNIITLINAWKYMKEKKENDTK